MQAINNKQFSSCPQGAALITSLVILLVLTVLGISAMHNAGLQENLVGNLRSHNIALQSADTALTYAENKLSVASPPPAAGSTGGFVVYKSDQPAINLSGSAYNGSIWNSSNPVSLPNVVGSSTYIVQYLEFRANDLNPETEARGQGTSYYRIIARGTGLTKNSVALIQEDYGVQGY